MSNKQTMATELNVLSRFDRMIVYEAKIHQWINSADCYYIENYQSRDTSEMKKGQIRLIFKNKVEAGF